MDVCKAIDPNYGFSVLVTGVGGALGGCIASTILLKTKWRVTGTFYRSNTWENMRIASLHGMGVLADRPNAFGLRQVDIEDQAHVSGLTDGYDIVINCAARTDVKQSRRDPRAAVRTNIGGLLNVLEDARHHGPRRFVHVSSSEVYGDTPGGVTASETTTTNPNNPYAATKVAGDALALAYANTYGLPVMITRCDTNYGTMQLPSKAIPTFVRHAIEMRQITVYGGGQVVRNMIEVHDHAEAILHLLGLEMPRGEIWNIAGPDPVSNNDIAAGVLDYFGQTASQIRYERYLESGHSLRQAMNCDKILATGWKPKRYFAAELPKLCQWYDKNRRWCYQI